MVLNKNELSNLKANLPLNSSDDFTLKVTTIVSEKSGSSSRAAVGDLSVDILSVVDTPVINIDTIKTTEDIGVA